MTTLEPLRQLRAAAKVGEALLAPETPLGRPVHMHLELTTVCDHVCAVCVRAEHRGDERHMPVEEARAHIDAVSPRFISLNGVGEPLLHPDWDEVVRHAVQRHGASVGFASAGTALAEQADRICRSGVSLIKVSFHGATPQTFGQLASGRDLEGVLDGIRAVFARRRELRRGPDIRLNYVVSRASLTEMAESVRVASSCGVQTIWFKGEVVQGGRLPGLTGAHDHAALSSAVEEASAVARELGVSTNLAAWRRELARVGELAPERRTPPPGRCLIPWISVFVAVDGTVLPCCNCAFHPGDGNMGRLGVDGTLGRIWRGRRYAELRREMKLGTYRLEACLGCPEPVTVHGLVGAVGGRLWPGMLPAPQAQPPDTG
jgi:MoaA/NifB/PqqE/SkfB family radical SAM enzyme